MVAEARPALDESSEIIVQQGLTADELRQGGYVIFFRHTTADQGQDMPAVDLEDCTSQRNMSEAGLRDARTIGQAFRKLAIPVDLVLSSEYCRALETARVAFGRAEPAIFLNFCCADIAQRPMPQEERFARLAETFATLPPEGQNIVLVGHGVGIVADLQMGEAAIYRPNGAGGFDRVAQVLPREWMDGVYRAPAPRP
jgi:phosphohistidine phosphatase SixA